MVTFPNKIQQIYLLEKYAWKFRKYCEKSKKIPSIHWKTIKIEKTPMKKRRKKEQKTKHITSFASNSPVNHVRIYCVFIAHHKINYLSSLMPMKQPMIRPFHLRPQQTIVKERAIVNCETVPARYCHPCRSHDLRASSHHFTCSMCRSGLLPANTVFENL